MAVKECSQKHNRCHTHYKCVGAYVKKVQVGKDLEKAQSEKDSRSKNRGGKN